MVDKSERNQKESSSSPGSSEESSTPSLTLGIIAAPEAPSEISNILASELSDLLVDYVDDQYTWDVQAVVDPFTGAADNASSNMEEIEKLKKRHEWDYAVGISDLPFFREEQFLVAEASGERAIAQISLPSLGFSKMVRRVREATLQLVSEMHHGSSEAARDQQEDKISEMEDSKGKLLRNKGARQLIGKGWLENIAPIHRVQPKESEQESDVRFTFRSRLSGYFRVTIGMVRSNHPFRIFSAFKSVVAVAFTTGAYALIFPTLWKLADVYLVGRSAILMITALITLVGWIIVSHGLWEKKTSSLESTVSLRRIYNVTTVVTLGIGVIGYYLVLYVCFFLATFLFIPGDLLESNTGIGHSVGILYYLSLAWVTTSLATFLGALGAGLADEEKVLTATYGYRQLRHKQEAKREEERREESNKK